MSANTFARCCRDMDNRDFLIDETPTNVRRVIFSEDSPVLHQMWMQIQGGDRDIEVEHLQFFSLGNVILGKRGRASERIEVNKSWVTGFDWIRKKAVLKVTEIVGVKERGEWAWIGLFGPSWATRRVPNLYQVREFDVVKDRLSDNIMMVRHVGLPAVVIHKHRFCCPPALGSMCSGWCLSDSHSSTLWTCLSNALRQHKMLRCQPIVAST